jgi:hypothetical protein
MTDRILRAALAAALLAPAAALAAASAPIVSGSVYVDYHAIPDAAVTAPPGVLPEASLKVQVDIHDELSFSTKACAGCHTLELDHVMLEYTPQSWFNVQVGRLSVPFGEYANRIDPSGHKAASAPLIYDMGRMAWGAPTAMDLGVLPMPYVDTGAMVFGQRQVLGMQAWYGIYGVAGLRGSNDLQWARMRNGNFGDNNRAPAGGARIALTRTSDPGGIFGDVSVGGSFTAGRYDDEARLGYAIWGADAQFSLWKTVFRGEWVERRTDLDPTANYGFLLRDDFFSKSGWYVEVEQPLGGHLALVGRVDQLRRSGAPLPGADDPANTFSRMTRHTAGVMITPVQSAFVKAGWEYWDSTTLENFHSFHFGLGGAF